MRFLCVNRPATADIFGQDYRLKPLNSGTENIEDILVSDLSSASELLSMHRDVLIEVSFDTEKFKGFPKSANRLSDISVGDTVLILRSGGIGGYIMLLPALSIFKKLFPKNSEIWLATQKEKHPLFHHHDSIDRLLPLPLRLTVLLKADKVIDFSSRQDWFDLESIHMTDSYLNFLGIDYRRIKNKAPRISWGKNNAPCVSRLFNDFRKNTPRKPLVLLNWTASNRLRDLPPEKLLFLTRRCDDVQFVVAQSATLSEKVSRLINGYGKNNIFDCTPAMTTLEDYISAISNCDAVVSTDTATGHIAESLRKPSLILYGPTIDDLWIRYYQKTVPLRAEYFGKICRSPCGITKNTEDGCPEAIQLGSPYSPCLLSISEDRIESAFREMLKII